MKVNYNMSAVVTNNQLLRTEGKLTKAMERLSSGLKINHSKDNPAGLAMSNKMNLQIDGLSQASRNASDGSSVLQTADGALDEVTNILQRMRELSVQAANDINSISERQAIQEEIANLREEVDRVSKDTEFNTKSLLDGSLDARVYAKNVSRVSTSIYVDPAVYQLTVDAKATKAEAETGGSVFDTVGEVGATGTISINGSSVDISATDTYEQAYEKIRNAAEIGEADASLDGGSLVVTAANYGSNGSARITFSNDEIAIALGFGSLEPSYTEGTDAEISMDTAVGFSASSTIDIDGNRVVITDKGGFEMSFLVDDEYEGDLEFEVTSIGAMTLQIGANQYQTMDVRIPQVDSKHLYLDRIDVTTVTGAERAIDELDKAIISINSVRSTIGAYENRLDYAVGSLDETEENVTSALSRIMDADMAEEMSEYTQQNVLQQAAISVLSQANDLPQQTLQLLN